MRELQEKLLALSADAYAQHQQRGDSFTLKVADVTAGLALKVKQLAAAHERFVVNARGADRSCGDSVHPT